MLREKVAEIIKDTCCFAVQDGECGAFDECDKTDCYFAREQANKVVTLIKSELDKLTVIDDETAKGEVLKYHCSPETTTRDIVITDVEFDLMSLQLQHTKKQLLALMGK